MPPQTPVNAQTTSAPQLPEDRDALNQARWETLRFWDELLERPLNVLSLVWLALLILDLVHGLPTWTNTLSNVIWGIFVADFVLSLVLAPHPIKYLKRNWLLAISLLLPALRIFRAFRGLRFLRAARLARGTRLLQILTRVNRSLRTLQRTLRRRRFGFVMLATLLVVLAGSAGMQYFEGAGAGMPASAPKSYWDWVYWTGMLLTSLGPEYWPITSEGRTLTFLLGLFGFTVFGYITASLASSSNLPHKTCSAKSTVQSVTSTPTASPIPKSIGRNSHRVSLKTPLA